MPIQLRTNISYFTDFPIWHFFCEINIYFSTRCGRCILMIPKIETTEGANCVDFSDDESWIQVNHGGALEKASIHQGPSWRSEGTYLLPKATTLTSHWKKSWIKMEANDYVQTNQIG